MAGQRHWWNVALCLYVTGCRAHLWTRLTFHCTYIKSVGRQSAVDFVTLFISVLTDVVNSFDAGSYSALFCPRWSCTETYAISFQCVTVHRPLVLLPLSSFSRSYSRCSWVVLWNWKHIYLGTHIQTLLHSLTVPVLAMVVLAVIYFGHIKSCYVM